MRLRGRALCGGSQLGNEIPLAGVADVGGSHDRIGSDTREFGVDALLDIFWQISERLHDVQDAATLQISDAEAEALRQRLCNVGNFRNLEAAAAETRIGVSCQREIVPPRARDRHMTARRPAFAVNDGIQQVDVRRVGKLLNVLYRRLDRKSTRLNSSHSCASRMPSSD